MSWTLQTVRTSCTSLLHSVQMSGVFSDSKHFVDMSLRPEKTVDGLAQACDNLYTKEDEVEGGKKFIISEFLSEWFLPPGRDLVETKPTDMSDEGPAWFHDLGDSELCNFAQQVYMLWRLLCRSVSTEVQSHPAHHTLIPLPKPFIIAGDRFRECYYWDSYWVIRGLMSCGLQQTARDIVYNMLHLIKTVGHMPNGNRIYYLNRSQPPLLSAMVMAAAGLHTSGPSCGPASRQILATPPPTDLDAGVVQFLEAALPGLIQTWEYWNRGDKSVEVHVALDTPAATLAQDASKVGNAASGSKLATYRMSRYYADWKGPRPESYREDWQLAQCKHDLATPSGLEAAGKLWRDLATAAESGWDFSSRWCSDAHDLSSIRTTQVIPADLNAFLAMLAQDTAAVAHVLGDCKTRDMFLQAAADRWQAINSLMWCSNTGSWQDLLLLDSNQQSTTSSQAQEIQLQGSVHQCQAELEDKQLPGSRLTQEELPVGTVDEQQMRYGVMVDAQRLERGVASNWVPLWCGAAEPGTTTCSQAVAGLMQSGLVQPGGVLTSLIETGQQWDAPNCWPPLQHMMVEALAHAEVTVPSDIVPQCLLTHQDAQESITTASVLDTKGQQGVSSNAGQQDSQMTSMEREILLSSANLGRCLAEAWLTSVYDAYKATGHMHEKYDATCPGTRGGGGEYDPQVGFGWTNGVTLDLLKQGYRRQKHC